MRAGALTLSLFSLGITVKCNSKVVRPFIPLKTCQIVPSGYQQQAVQHKVPAKLYTWPYKFWEGTIFWNSGLRFLVLSTWPIGLVTGY
jgi:hypothetical protein